MASKKIVKEVEHGFGLQAAYGGGAYTATACRIEQDWHHDGGYTISYQQGAMPMFNSDEFDTLDELEAAMRNLEPDLRKWLKVEYE